MESYFFARSAGGLTVDKVKAVISEAGYRADDYGVSQIDNDNVSARGSVAMSCARLENTAEKLGLTGVVVTSPSGSNAPATAVASTAINPKGAMNYGISIAMSQQTVAALLSNNYTLYGFKAVRMRASGGLPLVWFKSNNFAPSTNVEWNDQYAAYTSHSAIIPNGDIVDLNSYPITLGQQLAITTPQGTGTVGPGYTPLGIEIVNQTPTQMTCGILETVGGIAEPLCAFPLYNFGLDMFIPIQQVMLTISIMIANKGMALSRAFGPSLLIDLTSANHRAVSYDIKTGWSWGEFYWAQEVLTNTDVSWLLIEDY